MLYGLAKFFAPLAHPLGFLWLLLVILAAGLLKRRQWITGGAALGIALLMSLAGSRVPVYLLTTLEKPYLRDSISNVPPADAVVLLGGSFEYSRYDPMGFNVNGAADRVLTALELLRLKKAGALVLGGRGIQMDGEFKNEAHALAKWLANWNLPGAPVVILDGSGNTHDEAVKTAAVAKEKGWKKIHLVTTAFHMRRAAAVFRTAGLEVVPVACDFQRLGTPYDGIEFSVVPSLGGFQTLGWYLHERAGWFVYRANGWISSAAANSPP
ncbi:MAG: YdcF family protein [Verrucomicrobia bacterium]|nr:YdcF family protein [Verrucomicrobiota bacterium]